MFGTNKKIKTSKTEREKYKKMSSATIESSLESDKNRFGGQALNASTSSVAQTTNRLAATVDQNESMTSVDMSNPGTPNNLKMTESLPVRPRLDDAELFTLNVEKFNQNQSFAAAYLQDKKIQDPYKKAIKLLTSMIDLYRENFRLIDQKSYKFPEKDIVRI